MVGFKGWVISWAKKQGEFFQLFGEEVGFPGFGPLSTFGLLWSASGLS